MNSQSPLMHVLNYHILSSVFLGPAKDFNDQDLCDESSLQLDPWPWIGRYM